MDWQIPADDTIVEDVESRLSVVIPKEDELVSTATIIREIYTTQNLKRAKILILFAGGYAYLIPKIL